MGEKSQQMESTPIETLLYEFQIENTDLKMSLNRLLHVIELRENRMRMPRSEVFKAIEAERDYQISKWGLGHDHQQSLIGFVRIAAAELNEAEEAWINGFGNPTPMLQEIVQVAAVCVAALEMFGPVSAAELARNL